MRIQQNNFCAKIILKEGKVHDEHRKELEVECGKEDFENLQRLFSAKEYNTQIKWFRKRRAFLWGEIKVTLDYTKEYGHIIELEMMSLGEEKVAKSSMLKQRLASLGVSITFREEFESRFQNYKQNWKVLINEE